jgi:hypothetical protein
MPSFLLLVLLVAAEKILALKVDTSIHLAWLPCQPACLLLVPATSAVILVKFFCKLMCLEQSTFLRYIHDQLTTFK